MIQQLKINDIQIQYNFQIYFNILCCFTVKPFIAGFVKLKTLSLFHSITEYATDIKMKKNILKATYSLFLVVSLVFISVHEKRAHMNLFLVVVVCLSMRPHHLSAALNELCISQSLILYITWR